VTGWWGGAVEGDGEAEPPSGNPGGGLVLGGRSGCVRRSVAARVVFATREAEKVSYFGRLAADFSSIWVDLDRVA
jgi:hypothetical protein